MFVISVVFILNNYGEKPGAYKITIWSFSKGTLISVL